MGAVRASGGTPGRFVGTVIAPFRAHPTLWVPHLLPARRSAASQKAQGTVLASRWPLLERHPATQGAPAVHLVGFTP